MLCPLEEKDLEKNQIIRNNELEKYALPFPGVIRIEPASVCNLRCIQCPTGSVEMKRGIMSKVVFDQVLEEIARHIDSIRVVVLYHGGEPLLNEKFEDMVKAIAQMQVPIIKTNTNAMLLDKDRAEDLILSGLTHITFSLDGPSAQVNDSIRHRCDATQVLDNIRFFLERRAALKPQLNVTIASGQFIDPSNMGEKSEPEPPEYIYQALKNYGITKDDFECFYMIKWPYMIVDPHFKVHTYKTGTGDFASCDHIESTISIRWDGTVVPCCYDIVTGLNMGNIMQESIEDIWNGIKYLELRKSIAEKDYKGTCATCEVVRDKKEYLVKTNGFRVEKKERQ